jgi:hypothetical protein
MRDDAVLKKTNPRSSRRPARTKTTQPNSEHRDPAALVNDHGLSTEEKRDALEALEQDARQLAIAGGEGMSGGEKTNLRDVLLAKATVDRRSSDAAFAQVVALLETKRALAQGTEFQTVIANAIEALNAAERAIANMEQASPPSDAPRPGSRAELEEELEKEKLDPGA